MNADEGCSYIMVSGYVPDLLFLMLCDLKLEFLFTLVNIYPIDGDYVAFM
jgi:hypothetical protein